MNIILQFAITRSLLCLDHAFSLKVRKKQRHVNHHKGNIFLYVCDKKIVYVAGGFSFGNIINCNFLSVLHKLTSKLTLSKTSEYLKQTKFGEENVSRYVLNYLHLQ